MTHEERYFGNPLEDIHITSHRLLNFANDLLANLTADNPGGIYDEVISGLSEAIQLLENEVSGVDMAVARQKGATLSANSVLKDFKKTMSEHRGYIAVQLGGVHTPAYLQFYPHGQSEYARASKIKMAMLTGRVNTAATNYSAAIGASLATTLSAFENSWASVQGSQSTKKAVLSDQRTEHSAARKSAEQACLAGIYRVAGVNVSSSSKAASYVNFHLLYGATHKKHFKQGGTTSAGDFSMAFNKELTQSTKIKVSNLSDNADLRVGLLPGALAPDATGAIVKAGKTKTFKAEKLGDLAHTFLMILNLSNINSLTWKVEIIQ